MHWPVYAALFFGLLYLVWRMQRGGGPQGALLMGRTRGRWMQPLEVETRFSDVAGAEEAKEELQEIISFLKRPERYQRIGAKIPKGVLLVGPPGTGKTLLARAVAGEAEVPFFTISGSEFVEMFVGVGAARVRDLFRQAKEQAPCIVFIDELDALGRSRGGAGGIGSHEEREQTLNQLLVEMDGFQQTEAVVLMAATNRPEVLDAALLRPGRFDRHIAVTPPDRVGRKAILKVHTRDVPLEGDVNLDALAARTPGFSGADLANLVNEAALLAAREDGSSVGMKNFSQAIDRVVAGLEKKNRLLGEAERRRIAYHESGHALAAVLAKSEDRIHKVSIVPRGMGALGFTMQMPTDEQFMMTKGMIKAKLIGLLGGRAAEELVFGEPSTGAQNDLQKATEIARAMVIDYGMSDKVGPISVNRSRAPVFLKDDSLSVRQDVGEQLADLIDSEVQRIVSEALEQAMSLLRDARPHLDRFAERLLTVEVLEGPELDQLLSAATPPTLHS